MDLDNPLAANVGAILPDDSAKWLMALGKSIDLFSFWTLILLAIGVCMHKSAEVEGWEGVYDCILDLGGIRSAEGWMGVHFLVTEFGPDTLAA